jgi:hypothetical protein
MSTVATVQTILDVLRPQQTPSQWESDFVRRGRDWDDLVVRAIVLGLAPQLHHRFSTWSLPIPPRAKAKLAAAFQAQAQRNEAIYSQLKQVLLACANDELHPIALKGVHLAAHVYKEPALRPMNDIDLLFPTAELTAAETMLIQLGYGGKHKSAEMGAGVSKHTSTFRRTDQASGATSNPYLSANNDRTVEPHTSLEESWFGLKVDITPGIRERSERVELAGLPCLVLSREDLLLHIALHFCFHLIQGAPAMVQLSDLLAITQAEGVDWDVFVARAHQHRAEPYAYAGLKLAHDLLGAPSPDPVRDKLAEATWPPLRRRIAGLGLADILRRTQQKPLTNLRERLARGFQDRQQTANWAPNWHGRLQVWRTFLQPGRSDTGQMILQKLRR